MEQTDLVQKAKEYAEDVLKEIPEDFLYHNLEHTRQVAKAAYEIASKSDYSKSDIEKVLLAAWFHDLGYKSTVEEHEQESIRIMREKLHEWGVDATKIDKVAEIIQSTRMPQTPKDELSKVLCDADMYHLSTPEFEEKSEDLRQELIKTCKKEITKDEWMTMNVQFLGNHSYFTNYSKALMEPLKKKNLKKVKKARKKSIDPDYVDSIEKELIKLKDKAQKGKTPDRGIETMFRITSKNHLTLSGMADNKANIMISINSIILSVLVSVLFRKFEDYPNLIIPSILLVFVCLTTIVFAVLATRPNISKGKFDTKDILDRKVNLLFFGNFHGMELDSYMWGMKEMMKDGEFLYGSMIKDIYFLGKVLGKKYRMLRTSYTIFMFGFILAILAFLVAMLFSPNHG
ncbi:MAG: Pycsar system effector family protein [Bacteroidota bacterium]